MMIVCVFPSIFHCISISCLFPKLLISGNPPSLFYHLSLGSFSIPILQGNPFTFSNIIKLYISYLFQNFKTRESGWIFNGIPSINQNLIFLHMSWDLKRIFHPLTFAHVLGKTPFISLDLIPLKTLGISINYRWD